MSGDSESGSKKKPTLMYFNGPGRAELSRLILHAGGVEFEDRRLTFEEFGKLKFDDSQFGPGQFFGSVPCLNHNGFQISQSQAVALYSAEIGLTPNLSPQQRARDVMILGCHADMQTAMYKCLFGSDESKLKGKEALPARAEALLKGLERVLPAKGTFLHGGSSPSAGDIAVFDFCTSMFPGLVKLGIDISKFDKVRALVEKVRNVPTLKAYLAKRGF